VDNTSSGLATPRKNIGFLLRGDNNPRDGLPRTLDEATRANSFEGKAVAYRK